MPSESHEHRAPEGAHCAQHPEREAEFTCPRCGSYACESCFQLRSARCAQCLSRDPTESTPPIPWERPDLPALARFFATLGTAFSPVRSAPAFAREDVGTALRFMLLSAFPLALLAGVIPHTRTLFFAGNFSIRVLGHPSAAEIALDVVRAAAVEALLTLLQLGALVLPFASLVRAYSVPPRVHAAVRAIYYRIWLLPAAVLASYLLRFGLPAPDPTTMLESLPFGWIVASYLPLIACMLVMMSMTSTARFACRLGPGMSAVVVLVPVLLFMLVSALSATGAELILPPVPAAAQ